MSNTETGAPPAGSTTSAPAAETPSTAAPAPAASTTAGPGTTVTAPTPVQPVPTYGNLPAAIQARVNVEMQMRKLRNMVAGQIASLSWGQNLDLETRRAVASWGQEHGIDVTSEIHILGGRPYLNAQFYKNRLAAIGELGRLEYAYADHIEENPLLEALAADDDTVTAERARHEITRRAFERVTHNVPAIGVGLPKSVVVYRAKLRGVDREYTACKWCGTGKKNKQGDKFADPIGEDFPVETSETRATRRCASYFISQMPGIAAQIEAAEKAVDEKLGPQLDRALEIIAADDAHWHQQQLRAGHLAGEGQPPYGIESPEGTPKTVDLKRAQPMADPYGEVAPPAPAAQ